MLDEQTYQKLTAMKLFGMARSIKERLERRDHQDLSKAEFVGLLVSTTNFSDVRSSLFGQVR